VSHPARSSGPGDLAVWTDQDVAVIGTGVTGSAVARALSSLGARVIAYDERADAAAEARAEVMRADGVDVRLGEARPSEGTTLLVTSPGVPPSSPLLRAAADGGVPIWGDAELAWRLRPPGAAPWLVVTGTNGKTTTVRMLAAILTADGRRAVAAGNVGTPLIDVVLAAEPYDVLAVELSSFQLSLSESIAPLAAVILNLAPDHVDWHGSYEAYVAAKARAYDRSGSAIHPLDDPVLVELAALAAARFGSHPVGLARDIPPAGSLGVVEGILVDRAFVADPVHAAEELATTDDLFTDAPHVVADALAAAALARAAGVAADSVRAGLAGFRPDPHRIASVAVVTEVAYIDDSKATNPHAALASLSSYPHVVWVAGGLAKGADFDELVTSVRHRLRAAVLIGRDRGVIADALARHAPEVPVVDLASTETDVMEDVVRAAAGLAVPGDTVLLAPGCASWDMFANYGARGDAFASAVHRLAAAPEDRS
jgi:UDP-N-acetylmuramoylalanine--D-glutamate ligase